METFTVSVFGSEYNIKADGDVEHVMKVARIVDQRMREMDRRHQQPSTGRTAVLACMSLVDEQLTAGRADMTWADRRVASLIDKLGTVV
ncbi:cell division protein ZapA [candidate division WOR-3 bacterium]|nr:cell division protein ZapA [candidate division WOR-3 bacterium]